MPSNSNFANQAEQKAHQDTSIQKTITRSELLPGVTSRYFTPNIIPLAKNNWFAVSGLEVSGTFNDRPFICIIDAAEGTLIKMLRHHYANDVYPLNGNQFSTRAIYRSGSNFVIWNYDKFNYTAQFDINVDSAQAFTYTLCNNGTTLVALPSEGHHEEYRSIHLIDIFTRQTYKFRENPVNRNFVSASVRGDNQLAVASVVTPELTGTDNRADVMIYDMSYEDKLWRMKYNSYYRCPLELRIPQYLFIYPNQFDTQSLYVSISPGEQHLYELYDGELLKIEENIIKSSVFFLSDHRIVAIKNKNDEIDDILLISPERILEHEVVLSIPHHENNQICINQNQNVLVYQSDPHAGFSNINLISLKEKRSAKLTKELSLKEKEQNTNDITALNVLLKQNDIDLPIELVGLINEYSCFYQVTRRIFSLYKELKNWLLELNLNSTEHENEINALNSFIETAEKNPGKNYSDCAKEILAKFNPVRTLGFFNRIIAHEAKVPEKEMRYASIIASA